MKGKHLGTLSVGQTQVLRLSGADELYRSLDKSSVSQGRSLIYPVLHNLGQAEETIGDGKGRKARFSVATNYCERPSLDH